MSKLSRRTHSVIYIPGIGDDAWKAQSRLIQLWRIYGVQPVMHEIPWMDQSEWEPKYAKLLGLIDELAAKGHRVSLVGISAGAGAVINAFAARKDKISGVVCIAGKVNNPQTIGHWYKEKSPAFITSANAVPHSLETIDSVNRERILSRYAIYDQVVPRDDSVISGAHNKTVLSVMHLPTIVGQIIFGAPFFIRFLKK